MGETHKRDVGVQVLHGPPKNALCLRHLVIIAAHSNVQALREAGWHANLREAEPQSESQSLLTAVTNHAKHSENKG